MGKNTDIVFYVVLRKPGVESDFTLNVTNTNGDAMPILKMLPDLKNSKNVDGEWRGATAAPMKLFADKSDPSLCARTYSRLNIC